MLKYFSALSVSKTVLWCYLIWYLVTVWCYFDASPRLWLNSLGISAIIGIALLLSVSESGSLLERCRKQPWQTFRLFLMPFCVSSFASLIKGQGYLLMLPPKLSEQLLSMGLCMVFVLAVFFLKNAYRKSNGSL